MENETAKNLLDFTAGKKYRTIYADPPWQFANRTGKVAPENKKNGRYSTMTLDEIKELPVEEVADEYCHLYLWIPTAMIQDGLDVMKAWGFEYKTTFFWEKVRKDGEPDGRGVGFYFRNVIEPCLFGVKSKKGKTYRTLSPGRSQVNVLRTQKREHSRKPDEMVDIIEACSEAPRLEMFARGTRKGWDMWGNQAEDDWAPDWKTYGTKRTVDES